MNDSKTRVMWMIHFAFVAAVPMYLVIAALVIQPGLKTENQPFAAEPRATMLFVALCALALVQLIMAAILPQRFKQQMVRCEDSPDVYLAKRQTTMIITDAFYESIAIYGLVGIILGLKPWQGYALMAVSLVFLLMAIGRIRDWAEEYAKRARQL